MPGPLAGLRVLDMTIWQQGTAASAMLADLGADVLKVEEPAGGDPGRSFARIEALGGLSGYFEALNRGKRSIALPVTPTSSSPTSAPVSASGSASATRSSPRQIRRSSSPAPPATARTARTPGPAASISSARRAAA
jgi:hypothetical protein